jgi:succinate dehydrogenase / fumarate reductase cytochrome b subunit
VPTATTAASNPKSQAKLTVVAATQAALDPKTSDQPSVQRPLSPFMFPTWYRFQITSALSIVHRITGIGLALGSVVLAWWLIAVAAGGGLFAATHAFIASPIGMLLLFGWSIAFFYHLCNGIRHLAWDAGHGFELRTAARSGYAVLAATVLLTVLAWLYVFLA